MKTSYLNNITEEAVNYRRKINLPNVKLLRKSKLDHMVKLIRYRNAAFNGRIEL